MASDSLELLGDPYFNVWPVDHLRDYSSAEAALRRSWILINVGAKFTRLWYNSEEEEEEEGTLLVPHTEGHSIRFSNNFTVPLDSLMASEAGDIIAKILSLVHLPNLRFIVDKMLDTVRVMANERQEHGRVLGMNVKIDAFVEELPVPSEDDCYTEEEVVDDDDNDEEEEEEEEEDDDDAMEIDDQDSVVGFVPASKESIEALPKVKIEVSEKSPTCPVCLEDVLVGFEATRLPCLHCFHGDCIVKWLENSKLCPLCRFEMPTQD